MSDHISIISILTIGLGLALLFSFIAHKLKLPAMLGYLVAGYAIGPFSPGFVADLSTAEQLAEIGVILMLFGVGMHIRPEDLTRVKKIAIPGAIGQTFITTLIVAVLSYYLKLPLIAGLIAGLAIGVSSTVVLIKTLTDNKFLATPAGHVAIGWLIVEDMLTVLIILFLPAMQAISTGHQLSGIAVLQEMVIVIGKFIIFIIFMLTVGQKLLSFILTNIARTKSQEMLTVAIMACVFSISIVPYVTLGLSIPLGAFIAGIVIGKTTIRHEAAANALPFKNIFSIIFFLAVGMLFNPSIIFTHYKLFFYFLGVIVLIKPICAYLLSILFGLPRSQAIIIGLSLAQIGEFSFILVEEAIKFKIIPDHCYDIIVACSIVSILIHSFLLKYVAFFENKLQQKNDNKLSPLLLPKWQPNSNKIIVVGHSKIGHEIVLALMKVGILPTIVEQDIDIVFPHQDELPIFFGDATKQSILSQVDIKNAQYLILTTFNPKTTLEIIYSARSQNPTINIIAITKNLKDKEFLSSKNVHCFCIEQEIYKHFISLIFSKLKNFFPKKD